MSYTPIYVGQTWPPLHVTVKQDDGSSPPALTAVTFQMVMHDITTNVKTNGAGTFTVTDAANGRFDYTWNSADTATAGMYEVTFIITYTGGGVLVTDPIPLSILSI